MAFAEELKDRVMYGVESDKGASEEEDLEESSGYIIDYEQVLKDNSTGYRKTPPHFTSKSRSREDELGHNTILEQTQEANETESTPRTGLNHQESKSQHLDNADYDIR